MTQFPHSISSEPVVIFGIFGIYYQSSGLEVRVDGGTDEEERERGRAK